MTDATARRLGAAVAACMYVASCSSQESARCRGVCVGDPDPHCVVANGCMEDSDCPAGLTCAPDAGQGPCRGAIDALISCRPQSRRTLKRFALREGFHVPALQITVQPNSPASLAWTAPAGATFVSCAIFACQPAFAGTGQQASDDARAVEVIYNFRSCALAHRVVPASDGVFVLERNDEEYAFPTSDPVCIPARVEAGSVPKSELLAGCWAYDPVSVTAASELIPLTPDQVSGIPLPGTACGADGAECLIAQTGSFGVCFQGGCRFHCVSAVDCDAAASLPGEPSADAGTSCTWECRSIEPISARRACLPL